MSVLVFIVFALLVTCAVWLFKKTWFTQFDAVLFGVQISDIVASLCRGLLKLLN
jgi:hypothetical protein